MYEIRDIVVFKENHEWVGCIGFIEEVKEVTRDGEKTFRLMIGVPAPEKGVAYIYAYPDEIERMENVIKYPYEINNED